MNAVAKQFQIKVSKLAHFTGHTDSVYDFSIDAENSAIYSASADGHIVKWDIQGSGDGVLVLKAEEAFFSIYLDSENNILYAGTRTGMLYAIDLEKSQLIWRKKRHDGGLFFIRTWKDQLLTGGEDGTLRTGSLINKLSDQSLRTAQLVGNQLYIGSSDNDVIEFDLNREAVVKRLQSHTNSVFALAIDGDMLYSGGRDAMLKLWDRKAYNLINEVPAHLYQITSLDIRNGVVLSSSMDKSIKVWSDDLQLLKVIEQGKFEAHKNCVNKVRWIDDRMCVSCSDDRSLIVWQIELNS